jgi:DNA-binding NarL/FixJ family response regulator
VAGRGEAAGVRARAPARRSPVVRATDREVGVAAAVLVAGSEKAAAYRLGLSHSTVKHHLANARSKVGAATTAELVWMLAARLPQGALTPDGDDGGDDEQLGEPVASMDRA